VLNESLILTSVEELIEIKPIGPPIDADGKQSKRHRKQIAFNN